MGGVDAAQLLRAGHLVDVVVLAQPALRALIDESILVSGSETPLFRSQMVAAVRAEGETLDVTSEATVRSALKSSRLIGYSTGPSGAAVLDLVERLGLGAQLRGRLVQAPPGVSVASMLLSGQADLGFQQRSEMADIAGLRILGPLPDSMAVDTIFSGAVHAGSGDPSSAARTLRLIADPANSKILRRLGMELAARVEGALVETHKSSAAKPSST